MHKESKSKKEKHKENWKLQVSGGMFSRGSSYSPQRDEGILEFHFGLELHDRFALARD